MANLESNIDGMINRLRTGTEGDEYVEYVDVPLLVTSNTIQLSEIPDRVQKVTIYDPESNQLYYETINQFPTEFQYIVEYSVGLIRFNSAAEGKTLSVSFYGRGISLVSADRIYTKQQDGDVIETIGDIIQAGRDSIDNIQKINEFADKANNPIKQISTNSIPSSMLRETTDSDKIGISKLKAEVLAAMSGQSPVGTIPADGTVTGQKIALEAVTKDKIELSARGDTYPFQPNATLRSGGVSISSIAPIYNFMKKIELIGADLKKQYAIGSIYRNVLSANKYIWAINIIEVEGQTVVKTVCSFDVSSYTAEPSSGIDEVNLSELNSSGVSGKAWVDWSALANGTSYVQMKYAETGLHPTVYSGLIVKTEKIADRAITKDKIDPYAKGNTYPFQSNATLRSGGASLASVTPIYNFLLKIELYGADKSKQYAVSSIYRNVYNSINGKYIWALNVDEVVGQVSVRTVCQLNVATYIEPAYGIDEVNLTELSGSGVTGKAWVDWTSIPVGASYVQMRYAETGLHPLVYTISNTLADNSVTTSKIASESVTKDKLDTSARGYTYPFHASATLKSGGVSTASILPVYNFIKKIELYGADKSKQYSIGTIYRNVINTNGNIWTINVDEVQGQTKIATVCSLDMKNYIEPSTGIAEVQLNEVSSSGVSGRVWVDWSVIPSGTSYVQMRYAETGLHPSVYVGVGAILLDASVTAEKLDLLAKGNTYPFQPNANLKSGGGSETSRIPIYNFLKRIELYGADRSKQYAMSAIYRNVFNSGNNKYVWSINIDEVQGQVKIKTVCQLNVATYSEPANGIDEVVLNEIASSGVTGKCWVDWTAIPNGSAYAQMKYNEAGLHPFTYCGNSRSTTPITTNIVLPKYIPALVGKEMNIYLDNIIQIDNLKNYNVHISCTIGKYREERYTVTPVAVGDYPITIGVYRNGVYGELIASASSTIRVADSSAGSGLNKKCLFIGDSITESSVYLGELYNNLMSVDAMDITLLGTRGTSPIRHEGRAGWTMYNYLHDATFNNKSNSFLFNGVFNFTEYIAANGITGLDHVFVMMGTNDVSQALTTIQSDLAAIIASIRTYSSTLPIHIGIAPPPSATQDPWTLNQTRDLYRRKLFTHYQQLLTNYKGREGENLFLVPIYLNLDTVNNFPSVVEPASSRSTVMVTRQTDNVHPTNAGYYQIADTIYYHIKNFGI